MNSHPLLNQLNDPQRAAVTAPLGNCLVLAGAGSGKTQVLTHRVAWLIQEANVSPSSIVAVTFTNKAAAEMRERITLLLGTQVHAGMWIGTFHSLAHRLLRMHWAESGLPQAFQILDADDQARVIRRVMADLNLQNGMWTVKQIQQFINTQKDSGLRPEHLSDKGNPRTQTLIKCYVAYEAACARGGLIDFAELLLRAYDLWSKHPTILAHYQERFSQILVDEFQDTNTTQYDWIRLLAGQENHVMIVGDDDQSIYGWRGAKIENIQRFSREFSDSTIVRLEQNYRSTGTILSAANALIANNQGRLGKELWTQGPPGDAISSYAGFNETDEARFIVEQIRLWEKAGHARRDVAILYRSNAQSRVLEEALIQHGIPYRIYGGLRFLERAEIKDALGYLRLVSSRDDDAAFERIVNTPPRGIGEQTLGLLRQTALQQQQSLWAAANSLITTKALSARALTALSDFMDKINECDRQTQTLDLSQQAEYILNASGLFEYLEKEKNAKNLGRIENIQELLNAIRQFHPSDDLALTPLLQFLTHVALEAGDGQSDASDDCVQLMTLHSAKGLEFPLVFLCGMEEGLFPHASSVLEHGRLEEERRLCYVGVTRAMRKLFLTYAESRFWNGKTHRNYVSRFIREIPSELISEICLRVKSARANDVKSQPFSSPQDTCPLTGLYLGQQVTHATFGDGVVIQFDGRDTQTRVHVKFKSAGSKWLIAAYAKLIPV